MKKYIGSTIAFVLGLLLIISGLATPSPTLISGIVIILGVLAYRSAKKRKLGEVKASKVRITIEILAILIALAVVILQANLASLIQTDPISNLLIPVWVLVAYIVVSLWEPKSNGNAQA